MSNSEPDPEEAVRNHRPAIIAIILAVVVAILAYFVFTPGMDEQNDGIATTPPPAGTPITPAEGNDPAAPPAEN